MTGEIPQSDALAEAQVASLGELFSRDPEGYTRQDRQTIVRLMREQADRFKVAEAQAQMMPKGKAAKPQAQVASLVSNKSSDDLDL